MLYMEILLFYSSGGYLEALQSNVQKIKRVKILALKFYPLLSHIHSHNALQKEEEVEFRHWRL